jgi:hypothetical protein
VVAAQSQLVFLSVVDGNGEPVTDLEPDEVIVQWDGVDCETLSLEPIEWPVRVTVFVDNGEGGLEALQHMREGLKGFVDAIPEEVEVALLTLARQPRWVTRHTSDREELARGIDLIVPDAGAAARFRDALIEEAGRLNDDEERQYFPVIVMVASDGPEGSTSQQQAYDDMLVRMIDHSATVHTRMFSSGRVSTGRGGLGGLGGVGQQVQVGMNLRDVTRGTYEAVAAATRFRTLLPELAREIAGKHKRVSNQYRVTYAPPDGASDQPVMSILTSRQGLGLIPTLDGNVP